MAIRKKGKWKDRQHNGRQKERQTTQANRKKGKWKDRQYNGHQKEG
jgi:hypothetical protein